MTDAHATIAAHVASRLARALRYATDDKRDRHRSAAAIAEQYVRWALARMADDE